MDTLLLAFEFLATLSHTVSIGILQIEFLEILYLAWSYGNDNTENNSAQVLFINICKKIWIQGPVPV